MKKEILSLFLFAFMHVNAMQKHTTPFLYKNLREAITQHDAQAVNNLLEAGADPNGRGRRQYTLLYMATMTNNKKIIRSLLKHGAEVNSRNGLANGQTALHCAVNGDCYKAVGILLNHSNIDVNAKDTLGQTPLHNAVKNERIFILSLLLKRSDIEIDVVDLRGHTPLHWTWGEGVVKTSLMRMLLNHRRNDVVSLNALHQEGKTYFSLLPSDLLMQMLSPYLKTYSISDQRAEQIARDSEDANVAKWIRRLLKERTKESLSSIAPHSHGCNVS